MKNQEGKRKDRRPVERGGKNINGKGKQMEVKHVRRARPNHVRLLIDNAGFVLAYELLF